MERRVEVDDGVPRLGNADSEDLTHEEDVRRDAAPLGEFRRRRIGMVKIDPPRIRLRTHPFRPVVAEVAERPLFLPQREHHLHEEEMKVRMARFIAAVERRIVVEEAVEEVKQIVVNSAMTISELADKIHKTPAEIVKFLMFQGIMATVNQLRAARMDNTAPTDKINLSASSQQEAITKILEERRREMPFTMRWYDIRRLNNNEDANDDVPALTRTFYPYTSASVQGNEAPITYTLDKNSRRFAQPILNSEIESSQGAIEQNTYE